MKKFIKSFGYAISGLKICVQQTNFKVQLICALLVMALAIGLHCSAQEIAILFICCAMVLSLEMVNTAIEKLCDLYDTNYNQKIKLIKDVAAAAVLLASIVSVIVGSIIFWPYIF